MEFRKEVLTGTECRCYVDSISRFNRSEIGTLLLEVSLPILLFSVVSLIFTLILLVYAIMMNRQSIGGSITLKRTGNPGQRIPKEISERISPSNVMGLLESIFTEDEIAILTSLALSYIEDVRIEDTDVKHAGLRNKYQISTESGVAQRVIYEKDGVLERLSKIGLVEKVEPKVRPGGQKHLYRLYESNHIAACLLEHFRGEDIE